MLKKIFNYIVLIVAVCMMSSCQEYGMNFCATTRTGDFYRVDSSYVGDELNAKEVALFQVKTELLMEENLTTKEIREELERYVKKTFDKKVYINLSRDVRGNYVYNSRSTNIWSTPVAYFVQMVIAIFGLFVILSILANTKRKK
jgi:hypothetical protein